MIVAEPPAKYLVRPPAVVDTSVICCVLFKEAGYEMAASSLLAYELAAPYLQIHEVMNVCLRKRELMPNAVEEIFLTFLQLPILHHDVNPMEQIELARTYGLSAYDAAFLQLAAEIRAPLLTLDKALGKAAKQHLSGLD